MPELRQLNESHLRVEVGQIMAGVSKGFSFAYSLSAPQEALRGLFFMHVLVGASQ